MTTIPMNVPYTEKYRVYTGMPSLWNETFKSQSLGPGYVTIDGRKNPDWRQNIAKRQDATSPYNRDGVVFRRNRKLTLNLYRPFFKQYADYICDQPVAFPNLTTFSDDRVLMDQAVTVIKRRISDKVGDMALMAPMVELRELRSTISKSADLTVGLLKALIDIKRTKGKSAFRFASDAWLTYGFGVAPLVMDAANLSESIVSFLERDDHADRQTGSRYKTWVTSNTSIASTPINGVQRECRIRVQHKLSYKYIAGYLLSLKSANDYGALSHFHFEKGALVPTLWELTPYSWVVDYFTTAGAFMEDVFISDPTRCIYNIQNRLYTAKVTGVILPYLDSSYGFKTRNLEHGWYEADYFNFARAPLSALPNRILRFKTLDEIGYRGINRVLNLASLFGKSIKVR